MKQNSYDLELLSKQAYEETIKNFKKTRNIQPKGYLSQQDFQTLEKENKLMKSTQMMQIGPQDDENHFSTNITQESQESLVMQTDPKGDYIILAKEDYLNTQQTLFQLKNYIVNSQEFLFDSTIKGRSNNIIKESLVKFLQLSEDLVSKIVTNQFDIQKSITLFENQPHILIDEQSQTQYLLEQIKNTQNFSVFDHKVMYKERREDFFKKNPLLGNSRNFQSIFKKVDIFDRDIDSIQKDENVDKIYNKLTSQEQTEELIKVIYEIEYCKLYLRNYKRLTQLLNECYKAQN